MCRNSRDIFFRSVSLSFVGYSLREWLKIATPFSGTFGNYLLFSRLLLLFPHVVRRLQSLVMVHVMVTVLD